MRDSPPPIGSSTHPKSRSCLHRWADIGERSHVARPATEADRHRVLAHRRLRLVLLQAEDDATWRLARLAKQRLPSRR